jgi:hypothetical protein
VVAVEACGLDAVGSDSDDEPNLAFLAERIRVGIEVLLRELVYVRLGTLVYQFGFAGDDE